MLRRGIDETSRVGLEFEVEGNRGRGIPRRRWRECLKKDMEMRGAGGERCGGEERMDSWDPNGRPQASLGPER